MLITPNQMLITFLKIKLTFIVLLQPIFDYDFYLQKQIIVLKFYLNLLTKVVNLRLTDFQLIRKPY